jgi:hypothetical protein
LREGRNGPVDQIEVQIANLEVLNSLLSGLFNINRVSVGVPVPVEKGSFSLDSHSGNHGVGLHWPQSQQEIGRKAYL